MNRRNREIIIVVEHGAAKNGSGSRGDPDNDIDLDSE
jgi:hypothetical protein